MLAKPLIATAAIIIALSAACSKGQPRYSEAIRADVTGHERIRYLWQDMVPEALLAYPVYFDEQRVPADDIDFPNPNEDEYQAYVSAAPAQDLTVIDPRKFETEWVAVAILKVFDGDRATRKSKLPDGVSCIWVKSNTTTRTWESYFAEHQDDRACPPSLSGELDNRRRGRAVATQANPDDIPGAVRIEPSAKNEGQQIIFYVGARCGNAWCTMSLRNEELKRREINSGGDPRDMIPGWYDIQPLAYFDKSDEEYERSDVWAKFVPLAALDQPIPESNTGVVVGRIYTNGKANADALAQLKEHWGLNTWQPGASIDVALRKEKVSSNPDAFKYYVELVTGSEKSTAKQVQWREDPQAVFLKSANNPLQLRADYATVRLAWQDATADRFAGEDLWLRCDLGCCTVY